MKKTFTFMLLLSILISCKSQTSNNFQSLTAVAYQMKLNTEKNSQILDVRTPEEFAAGHLENAVNINWNSENFDQEIKKFNKTKPIFVNCQAGGRSKKAAERLLSLGFKKIFELKGGINDWISNNFLTVK